MTQQVLENGQAGNGNPGQPDQSISGTAGAQTSNGDLTQFEARMRSIAEEVAGRVAQSTKDRRIGRLENELNDFRPVLGKFKELIGQGLTPEQAEREIEFQAIRDRVFAPQSTNEQPKESAGTQIPQVTVQAHDVLRSMGLSVDDPEVAMVYRESGGNLSSLIAGATRIVTNRAAAPKPSPSSTAAPMGGTPPEVSPERLKSQYIQEVMQNRGNKAMIRAIQQKYLDQGLDVSTVPFTV